ncbi:hypothetical protein AFE_1846 [Acidithiobacillus ferrooxidans ATCC 23270]|uniref:Uncharacterized protein n=1 Tax=Acidithiobacillus ferrooxidans (strain ATCC 23270 / DSM 14882 / CIP 104768 / NCIMB 8455) TaxID=243159 RepID=B7JBV0_ACIF2|nr:hypothetical protein AFE_1846 [Acidithiobacillus ferrooxidans ATCC 23270]
MEDITRHAPFRTASHEGLSTKAQETLRPPRRRRIRHDQGNAFLIADPGGFLNFMGAWAGADGGQDSVPRPTASWQRAVNPGLRPGA